MSEQKAAEQAQNDSVQVEVNEAQTSEVLTEEESLQAEIAKLQQQLEEAKENNLRVQAEMQNVRRRAEQDVEKAHRYGLEKIINELLPVVDNLERAITSAQGDGEHLQAIRDGVEMTLSAFLAALQKFNVETVDPQGEVFNPELHQAVSMVPSAEVEANKVLSVMMKGYTLNGRLLRPAMVVVSKGAA